MIASKGKMGSLRTRVEALLRAEDFEERLSEWSSFPARQVVNPLISFLCCVEDLTRWRAVTAFGVVMAEMARSDMESARVVMRRLIWSLNDESGGIGWGAPEAMGEAMASHEALAGEYFPILLSYIREDGNLLENAALERGVLWGLGRVAQVRPHLLQHSAHHLLRYLHSENPTERALVAWTFGFLDAQPYRDPLEELLQDEAEALIYQDSRLMRFRVGDLVAKALGL